MWKFVSGDGVLAFLSRAPLADCCGTGKEWRICRKSGRLACALVVARIAHPSSEREAHRWLASRSAAFKLLEISGRQAPSLSKLYRIGDLL